MESSMLVADELYFFLLRRITAGEWKIGEKIPSENQICKEHQTSRITVRTALHKLQAQGFIVTKPGKGSFVVKNTESQISLSNTSIDLSANDYKYMIQLRQALEFTSIEIMCSEGTQEDFDKLENAYNKLRDSSTPKQYADADFEFHYSIIEGSHNPVFIQVYDIFRDTLYKYFYEMSGDNRDNNWDNAKNNHRMIKDAILSRNPEKAESIIHGTFEYNYNRLSPYFKKVNHFIRSYIMFSKEWLMKNKLVAISRKVAKEDIKNTAKALYEGGIRSLEITFDQSNPNCIEETVRSIEIVREVMGERMMIGAGTVLNVEQAIAAAKAGASFVLSPDTNVKVIDKVKDLGLISVPGAMTPSEIMVAWNHGADIVKLFPAGILTLAYYKAIKGPISHVPLMAVGGVGLENMKSFLDAGFCSCGIGSNIVRNDLIASKRFNDLTNLAKEYVSQIEEKTE